MGPSARHPTIVSLFDYSGRWSSPWQQSGFNVIQVDIKLGSDILQWRPPQGILCVGVLAAPPCTDFAASGAQYWASKDAAGTTDKSLALVRKALELKDELNPRFWILENPVGRLKNYIGDYKTKVHPYEYAGYSPNPEDDAYTKLTCFWGDFDLPEKKPIPPVRSCTQGSWLQKLGGKSERTKTLRSMTPLGLAWACYHGNINKCI